VLKGAKMIGKEVGKKSPVTLPEAYEILEARKKDGELGYEQKLAYEHASKFKKLSVSKARELKQELLGLGLSDTTATKIIDIMPSDLIQLKQVLLIEKKPIEEDMVNMIMQAVQKYRGK